MKNLPIILIGLLFYVAVPFTIGVIIGAYLKEWNATSFIAAGLFGYVSGQIGNKLIKLQKGQKI